MMKKTLLILAAVGCLLSYGESSYAQFWKKKSKSSKVVAKKKVSDYDKLFKDKKVETSEGFITLHKIDNKKLLFEFPLNLLNKDMVIGSTVSKISNNLHAVVGQKPHGLIHIQWTKDNDKLNMRTVNSYMQTTSREIDKNIKEAIKNSNIGAIYKTFDIKAYTKDSSKVVIDVTDFFLSNIKDIDPFWIGSPYARGRTSTFNKKASILDGIKAFNDNISVKSYLSYVNTTKTRTGYAEYKTPFTALLTRTIMLLPEEPMLPRLADPRIGAFYTAVYTYEADKNGVSTNYYARRFRLDAKDVEAHKRGELVEPVKPITFYIDNNFPESWKEPVRLGVLAWNKAFEKIGFKNAVVVKDFPENDPEFDPDNLKYNCIRYAPTLVANSMGPSWFDPRTGEIINASVYIYHNIVKILTNWRFVQTAQCDETVRHTVLPPDVLAKGLKYVVTHEVGHCLDMMHNMAASAAIPTEKLRDPEFTKKHGTTYSVMDYARFNYVAQPGDEKKGVKLSPPELGIYDYYFIKWLYSPVYDANTPEEVYKVTKKWIDEKAGDPRYRYGKQQLFVRLDPSSLAEDLGDDPVKSSEYGVRNLKYILKHLNEWVGDEDEDYSFRQSIFNACFFQYQRYLLNVLTNIGGMYLNESFAGDPRPAYSFVSREKQEESQKWILKQIEEFEWLEGNPVIKSLPLQSNIQFTTLRRNLDQIMVAYYGNLKDFPDVYNKDRFTIGQYLNNTYNSVWKPTIKGQHLNMFQRDRQYYFVHNIILGAGLAKKKDKFNVYGFASENESPLAALTNMMQNTAKNEYGDLIYSYPELFELDNQQKKEEISGYSFLRTKFMSFVSNQHYYLTIVDKVKKVVEKALKTANETDKGHYKLLLNKINRVYE